VPAFGAAILKSFAPRIRGDRGNHVQNHRRGRFGQDLIPKGKGASRIWPIIPLRSVCAEDPDGRSVEEGYGCLQTT
jgi:hypothetical protein